MSAKINTQSLAPAQAVNIYVAIHEDAPVLIQIADKHKPPPNKISMSKSMRFYNSLQLISPSIGAAAVIAIFLMPRKLPRGSEKTQPQNIKAKIITVSFARVSIKINSGDLTQLIAHLFRSNNKPLNDNNSTKHQYHCREAHLKPTKKI